MSESSFAKRQSRLAARAGSPPRRVDLGAARKQIVAFFRKPPVAVASAGLLVLQTIMLGVHALSGDIGHSVVNLALLAVTAPVLWFRLREACPLR